MHRDPKEVTLCVIKQRKIDQAKQEIFAYIRFPVNVHFTLFYIIAYSTTLYKGIYAY